MFSVMANEKISGDSFIPYDSDIGYIMDAMLSTWFNGP
jgi:hypothetical protein